MINNKIWIVCSVSFSFSVGVMISIIALYMGFQHNPQGEFYDPNTLQIDYLYVIQFVITSTMTVAIPIFVIGMILLTIYNLPKFKRHASKN